MQVGLLGDITRLRNLVTDEVVTPQASQEFGRGRRGGSGRQRRGQEQQTSSSIHLLPHSYVVFAAEQ